MDSHPFTQDITSYFDGPLLQHDNAGHVATAISPRIALARNNCWSWRLWLVSGCWDSSLAGQFAFAPRYMWALTAVASWHRPFPPLSGVITDAESPHEEDRPDRFSRSANRNGRSMLIDCGTLVRATGTGKKNRIFLVDRRAPCPASRRRPRNSWCLDFGDIKLRRGNGSRRKVRRPFGSKAVPIKFFEPKRGG